MRGVYHRGGQRPGPGAYCALRSCIWGYAAPPRTACGSPTLPCKGVSRLLGIVAGFLAGKYLLGDQARVLPDRRLDAGGNVRIVAQECLCVLAALADALA